MLACFRIRQLPPLQGGPAPGDAAQPHRAPWPVPRTWPSARPSARAAAYAAEEEDKLAGLRVLLAKGPIIVAKRQQ